MIVFYMCAGNVMCSKNVHSFNTVEMTFIKKKKLYSIKKMIRIKDIAVVIANKFTIASISSA